ncbi:unnamed protein product [Brachionus calyciflorus]|uniref:Uncharacterized protein n=1 Tax=Brachionus calyciflorus TaxID=104777 RepID=A0A814ICK2_9BILA|nr:unnamed protein product [Brachionus calyciflorus]
MERKNSSQFEEKKLNSEKIKRKHSDFLKKIVIPRSGSYNLEFQNDAQNSTMKILNDEIELNSAEPLCNKTNVINSILDNTNMTSLTSYGQDSINAIESINSRRKKTFLGFPLICCTYFAAIYSLLAYGATSLLSIIELMMNNSPKLFPLYLLLAGYLLITLMSFLLIVAIQREKLNLILFWIISLSVFILPEIGLNIVLAENSFNWFNSKEGLYTLIALVVRVTIDLPCIGIILAYHINRTRRNNFLKKMIKPLKKNIMNGEVLKSYNNLDTSFSYPLVNSMPEPLVINTKSPVEKNHSEKFSPEFKANIGFKINEKNNETFESDPSLSNQSFESRISDYKRSNTYRYTFNSGDNYEILVRPSKTGEFSQRFVNVGDVKILQNSNHKNPYKTNRSKQSSGDRKKVHSNTKLIVESVQNQELINEKEVELFRKNNSVRSNRPEYVSIEKRMDFFDETNLNIPISYESPKSKKEKISRLFSFNNQTLPFTAEREIRKKYQNLLKNNQTFNMTNHHIYLPKPCSMVGSPYRKKISGLNLMDNGSTNFLRSPGCNCVNIAACSRDKINEFIHSNECEFYKMKINKTNSSTSMYLSNPELFMQRKHF